MWKLLRSLSLLEKITAGLLLGVILISSFQIGDAFYAANSKSAPDFGGTFVEGVTGEFRFLNPVFAQTDLDRDVVSLTSCGLTRFDPVSNAIVDDAADHTLSTDQKVYTFRLKDNLQWHDGVPVTADDVVFTFREIIQHADFPNPTLAADFADVTVTKIDDRTVTLTLKKKYAFFIYNTTIGLLPKHLLGGLPVADLLSADFNLRPVGCGPYQIDTVTGSQIRLTANPNYFRGRPYLDTVVFRVFPDEEQLFKNLDSIQGTKNLSAEFVAKLQNDARLAVYDFTLPQYVALFFNTDHEILKNEKTRLGLQLATDKNQITAAVGKPAQIIDTPLLEIANSDWKYEFDETRADGALFDAGWQYPAASAADPTSPTVSAEAAPTVADSTATAAQTDLKPAAADPKFITQPSAEKYFATDSTEFFVEGAAPADATGIKVGSYQLSKFKPGDADWSYKASTQLSTLKPEAENEYVVTAISAAGEKELDRIIIFQSADAQKRSAWLAEKTGNSNSTASSATESTPAAEVVTQPAAENSTPTETVVSPTATATNTQPIRVNVAGQTLSLSLIVPAANAEFVKVAETVKELWLARGVDLKVETLADAAFAERLKNRDYDIVLFGQNLGYNMDTYAFWHSSAAVAGGSNLANLKSSAVNAWLEQIRGTFDLSERRRRLASLRDVMAEEVPAVFLYTPEYSYLVDQKIAGFNLGRLALKHDRLANLPKWFVKENRELNPEVGFTTFLVWLWQEL